MSGGVAKRHKNTIAKIKPGDKLIFYVKQERKNKEVLEPKIVGIFEAISEPSTDSTRIFKSTLTPTRLTRSGLGSSL